MNGSIRISAKTVDDAITEALIQLGVTSDRLEYEVIEKGSAGFLGIGMKQAVIEARKKSDTIVEEKTKPKTELEVEPKAEVQKDRKEDINSQTELKVDNQPNNSAVPTEEKSFTKRNIELTEVKQETKEAVESFLKETLKAMGMSVELVSTIDSENAFCVDMKGDNMGILIGKRGQTLDALQYLANRVANKHQEEYVRVKLDTENYRARREETLKNLAKNIAYKVKRSKRAVSLEPMNPYERRIIHAALQSDNYVTTHSEGEEPYRKVVVTLKKS